MFGTDNSPICLISKIAGLHRSLLPLIVAALAVLWLPLPTASAESRTVTVGVYENAPKIFTSQSGKPAGIFIDVIEHIAKLEGWDLVYVSGTWATGLNRLEKSAIDLMPDVAYSPDRGTQFAFHKVPVISSWVQVYASKGSGIRSIVDLNNKRVAVLERSVQQEAFVRITDGYGLNTTLIAVPDYETMFAIVADGEADAAITNRFYGLLHAKKIGLEETAIIFEPYDLFFAAPKGDPKQLLNTIDSRLLALKKDSQSAYYQSLKHWVAEEVQFKIPRWLQLLGLALGGALAMSLVGSLILRHQVNERTRELQHINQEMEQRIIERTGELTAANERLKELDRLKSMFIASMSHELRTPLNSIIGFTGITLQGLSGDLNEEQRDNLSRAYQSGKHLLALITDVIDISKIEAGRVDAFPEPLSLREIIDEAVATVSAQLKEKKLGLQVELATDLTLYTDRKRLLQCVINLLSNAVKFTEQGGVTLAVREQPSTVEITITDTGIGIAEQDLPKLFEAFERLETHLMIKAGGTGLGLYLTKKLATDILHGSVSVQSKVGEGSTFSLHIPKAIAPSHPA